VILSIDLVQILACEYALDCDVWLAVSDSAKDMIRGLLEPQPNQRLTIRQALIHPWLKSPLT
jgi:serine/threonine protein kinase